MPQDLDQRSVASCVTVGTPLMLGCTYVGSGLEFRAEGIAHVEHTRFTIQRVVVRVAVRISASSLPLIAAGVPVRAAVEHRFQRPEVKASRHLP